MLPHRGGLRRLTIFLILPLITCGVAWSHEMGLSDDPEISMAHDSIVATLIAGDQNTNGVSASPIAPPPPALLGLAIFDKNNSKSASEELASLLMYKRDGEFAENYECIVLNKGPTMARTLAKINSELLSRECRYRVNNLLQNKLIDSNYLAKVCWDSAHIDQEAKGLIKSIQESRRCK